MKNRLIIFLLTNFLFTLNLFAYYEFKSGGTYEFSFQYLQSNAGGYYDLNGKLITSISKGENELSDYLFDFKNYCFKLNFEYSISNKLVIGVESPINYYNLTETYKNSDGSMGAEKANLTLFKIQYIGIKSSYIIYEKKKRTGNAIGFICGELRLPTAYDGSIYNSKYQLLDGGLTEVKIGAGINVNLAKSFIEAIGKFSYRSYEPANYFDFHFETGFETVPDTKLYLHSDIVQSLSSLKSSPALTITRTPERENYISGGFGFDIYFNKQIKSNFIYSIILNGRNTWNWGMFAIGIYYYI